MLLTAFIDDIPYELVIPQEMLEEGEGFFRKMDADMDAGWQMGAEYVEHPGPFERCQSRHSRSIDADKRISANWPRRAGFGTIRGLASPATRRPT